MHSISCNSDLTYNFPDIKMYAFLFVFFTELCSPTQTSHDKRLYEVYNETLPDFLASASTVASRYPSSPTGGLETLLRFVNNKYVPCDEDTIILRRGPAIFGWKNRLWIAALFQFHPHHGYSRVIYDEELHEQRRVSLGFLISMGVGKEVPSPVKKKRSNTRRILGCFGSTCGRHNTREKK